MAATNAKIGYGTQLQYDSGGSPGTWTTVAEVLDIDGPNIEAELVEATHMESPDGYREYIQGLKDGGEVTFATNLVPGNASQAALKDMLDDGDRRHWQIIFPVTPSVIWSFDAIVRGLGAAIPVGDRMQQNVTLKITGSVDIA